MVANRVNLPFRQTWLLKMILSLWWPVYKYLACFFRINYAIDEEIQTNKRIVWKYCITEVAHLYHILYLKRMSIQSRCQKPQFKTQRNIQWETSVIEISVKHLKFSSLSHTAFHFSQVVIIIHRCAHSSSCTLGAVI